MNSNPTLRDQAHEQNDNWEWSDSFTHFVNDEIEGFSLKVCSGLKPICDVNLDIKDFHEVAESENADFIATAISESSPRVQQAQEALKDDAPPETLYASLYSSTGLVDGIACRGDMFSLPFEDNSFDTLVSDPPWLGLSANERKSLFDELVRVVKPTGKVLYNAQWKPKSNATRRYQDRFRMQKDFWGGPSFALFYRRLARTHSELFDAHEYESDQRYPEASPFWSESFNPEAVSLEHNTDPKMVNGNPDHHHRCCPMCGCSQLRHLTSPYHETDDGRNPMYECLQCEYRVDKSVVHELAAELEAAAEAQNVAIQDLEDVAYTPDCVEEHLEAVKNDGRTLEPLSVSLPWVPSTRAQVESGGLKLPPSLLENNLSDEDRNGILQLIANSPGVHERTGGSLTELSTRELEKRARTLVRAVKETSLKNVQNNLTARPDDSKTAPQEKSESAHQRSSSTPCPSFVPVGVIRSHTSGTRAVQTA